MKVYNFVENKNVLALFPTLRKLLTVTIRVTELSSAASLGRPLSACPFSRRTKLSTVSFTDVVVVVFTFDIVLNSCILNCFVFSLYMSSI